MKMLRGAMLGGVILLAGLQFIHPAIPKSSVVSEWSVPPQVREIIENRCYSCHSNENRLAWFDQIIPAYWLVRYDVLKAREHLNFQTLGAKTADQQRATLYEAVNMVELGAMPLPSFRILHPEAKVTQSELQTLKAYLAPWAPLANTPGRKPTCSIAQADAASPVISVQPALNGLSFDPSFKSWRLLSMTDRGDNNTFRFILGNDIAWKGAQSGNVAPWPGGSRLAKIAWAQERGADGMIYPGRFIQVEFMEKDAHRYGNTEGWGWGRWRGLELKPYGKDERFVNECTGCHLPVRGNDSIYSLPITNARVSGEEVVNRSAALPADLPYQPLGWSAITMYVDPKTRTMATLYRHVSANKPEAVLALVTWNQRDDPHWFGARIPNRPESVEFVEGASSSRSSRYRRFAHADLTEVGVGAETATQRVNFILALCPAQLP